MKNTSKNWTSAFLGSFGMGKHSTWDFEKILFTSESLNSNLVSSANCSMYSFSVEIKLHNNIYVYYINYINLHFIYIKEKAGNVAIFIYIMFSFKIKISI